MANCGISVLCIEIEQQVPDGLGAQVGHKSLQAVRPDLDAGAVRFQEDGLTDEHGPQPDSRIALEDQEPGLVLGTVLPARFRREDDPLQDEMRTGNEHGSSLGKAPRNGLAFSRPSIRCGHGVFDVKLPLSTMVEKAERRVASLLDLRDHESRADGMDHASGDENDVVLRNPTPLPG